MKYLRNNTAGFALVEVIVSLSIISLATLGVIGLAAQNIKLSTLALQDIQAGYLLEEGAEMTKILRDNDWNTLADLTPDTPYYFAFSSGTEDITVTPDAIGIFTRTIAVSEVKRDSNDDIAETGTTDDQTLLVTITVSWDGPGGGQTKNLQFYITDFFAD